MEAHLAFGGEQTNSQEEIGLPLGLGAVAFEGATREGIVVSINALEVDPHESDYEDPPLTARGHEYGPSDDVMLKARSGRTRQRQYIYNALGQITGVTE